jgi:DivIVA domain-containing protein
VVLSFSRPDPSSPTAVAGATFSASRRGYDQDEVRDFLRMVSAELSRLHERVVFLERELVDNPQGRPLTPVEITEDTVAELLGEETARIVQAAREAAHKIKARSEESAAKQIREATEEAARIREEAELECARRRQDANADAEAEILMAKQQGRDMVNEARAYRERVLADVTRRREMAREQLEELFHGRDRLVQAFERARTATDDVLRDITETVEEPTEFINLAPTTGPVPVIVQVDDVERTEALRPVSSSAPAFAPYDQDQDSSADTHQSVNRDETHVVRTESLRESVDSEPMTGEPIGVEDHSDGDVDGRIDDYEVAQSEVTDSQVGDSKASETAVLTDPVLEVVVDREPETTTSNVVPLFARTDAKEAPDTYDDPEDSPLIAPKSTVVKADDIFARLRRASTDIVAKDAASHQQLTPALVKDVAAEPTETVVEAEPTPARRVVAPKSTDTACFDRRSEVLVPVIVSVSRKIKRVLADEQNQILDALRAKQPIKTLELLVGSKAEHSGRFTQELDPLLNSAALAGARSLSDASDAVLAKKVHSQTHSIDELVISTLVAPLRERLSRGISEASGSNAELASLVRLVYREWKNQLVDEHVDDIVLNAYGRGALAVLNEKSGYCWMVDPDGPPCSDAEDNSLAGAVQGGTEFPTGHTHAPAHPGCRCALVACDN